MSITEKKTEQSRRDIMHAIERKHLGRCLDQLWGQGRRVLVERMELIDRRSNVIVVKEFEKRVPTSGSGGEWPDLIGAWVYVPIDDKDNTWEGLDRALEAYRVRLLG
jgi:hypothetical protein